MAVEDDVTLGEEEVEKELNEGRRYSEDAPDRNVLKAVYHYRLAADAGSPQAALEVADLVSKEKADSWKPLAEHYYRIAIAKGCKEALVKLGDLYYLGDWNNECIADPAFNMSLYMKAALLYFSYAKEVGDSAERELRFLGRMLSSNWIRSDWSFYGPLVEFLAENDNDDALHIYLDGNIPEPSEVYGLDELLAETFEIPELKDPAKRTVPKRTWGRSIGPRNVSSVLYDMGIEFTRSRNGIIKTKKGFAIKSEMERIIAMGYKFKYSPASDKWTYKDVPPGMTGCSDVAYRKSGYRRKSGLGTHVGIHH